MIIESFILSLIAHHRNIPPKNIGQNHIHQARYYSSPSSDDNQVDENGKYNQETHMKTFVRTMIIKVDTVNDQIHILNGIKVS